MFEDVERGIGQKHAPGIKDDIMQDCEALALIVTTLALSVYGKRTDIC
jgi:hypothetical protein